MAVIQSLLLVAYLAHDGKGVFHAQTACFLPELSCPDTTHVVLFTPIQIHLIFMER